MKPLIFKPTLSSLPTDILRNYFFNDVSLYARLAKINRRFYQISQIPSLRRQMCDQPIRFDEVMSLVLRRDNELSINKRTILLTIISINSNSGYVLDVEDIARVGRNKKLQYYETTGLRTTNLEAVVRSIWNRGIYRLLPGDEYRVLQNRIGCQKFDPTYAKEQTLRNFDKIVAQLIKSEDPEDLDSYLSQSLVIRNEELWVDRLTPKVVRATIEKWMDK